MKIAAIDIGSNSVRLMLRADGTTLYKRLHTTRLGEGLASSGSLKPEAIERTAQAVAEFAREARREQADKLFAFATAAVRASSNGRLLVGRVRALCGLEVDVISGEEEAAIGLKGAVGNGTGGIIDIGGASTELSLQQDGKLSYSKSLPIGTVRLLDLCGQDRAALEQTIVRTIAEYGAPPCVRPIYGIGGTATTLAAVKLALPVYDPEKVHGCVLTRVDLVGMTDRILSTPVEERRHIPGMDLKKLDVIGGGSLLLLKLMEYLDLPEVTISESDNLEGYVRAKGFV